MTEKEKKNLIWVGGTFGVIIASFLIAYCIDTFIFDGKLFSSKPTVSEEIIDDEEEEEEDDVKDKKSEAFDEAKKTVEEIGDKIEETVDDMSTSVSNGIPSSPSCTVTGNLASFGRYTLVINEHNGQICPGVSGKEGIISDVVYDATSGELTLTACSMSGKVVGQYTGYLQVVNGVYEYSGRFVNNGGRDSAFTMTGHR